MAWSPCKLGVLENSTCSWSTWDGIRSGVEPRPDLAETLQERAWSSPIWYVPNSSEPARGAPSLLIFAAPGQQRGLDLGVFRFGDAVAGDQADRQNIE